MNHCRRCDSDYEKPGTCNCFAPQAAPLPYQPVVVPYIQTGYWCHQCNRWVSGTHYCYGYQAGSVTITTEGSVNGEMIWYDLAGNRIQVTPTREAS